MYGSRFPTSSSGFSLCDPGNDGALPHFPEIDGAFDELIRVRHGFRSDNETDANVGFAKSSYEIPSGIVRFYPAAFHIQKSLQDNGSRSGIVVLFAFRCVAGCLDGRKHFKPA